MTCVESTALQTAAAMKLPRIVYSAMANVGIARTEQPELGGSAVVSLLVIELTWLGNAYGNRNLPLTKKCETYWNLLEGIARRTAFDRNMA